MNDSTLPSRMMISSSSGWRWGGCGDSPGFNVVTCSSSSDSVGVGLSKKCRTAPTFVGWGATESHGNTPERIIVEGAGDWARMAVAARATAARPRAPVAIRRVIVIGSPLPEDAGAGASIRQRRGARGAVIRSRHDPRKADEPLEPRRAGRPDLARGGPVPVAAAGDARPVRLALPAAARRARRL